MKGDRWVCHRCRLVLDGEDEAFHHTEVTGHSTIRDDPRVPLPISKVPATSGDWRRGLDQ